MNAIRSFSTAVETCFFGPDSNCQTSNTPNIEVRWKKVHNLDVLFFLVDYT